jgi:hypothetical protein
MDTLNPQRPELGTDVIRYISALLNSWRMIIGGAVLGASLMFAYCQSPPDVHEAFVRMAVVAAEDPDGIQPDERRASEVLTLVEQGLIMGTSRDNYLEVTRAKLRSRLFTLKFMESNNVYQHLFAEHWDGENGTWVEGFQLNKAEAIKWFGEQIRFIEHNPETDIITIGMRWTDPALARDWANLYVSDFNDHIRKRILDRVDRKQSFLRAELQRSDIVDMEKSIYRPIEAQTAIAMLANLRDEYAIEVIDPATMPFDRFSLAPRRFTIFGFVSGAMLVCFFVIGRLMLQRFMTIISELKTDSNLLVEGH